MPDRQEIDVDGLPELPSPGDFDTVKFILKGKPEKIFLYRKRDGTEFAAGEQEAATQKYGKVHDYVGFSDGQTFYNILKNSGYKINQLINKNEAQELLRKAEAAEFVVAKENMVKAKRGDIPMPHPTRIEYFFDGSVPLAERRNLAGDKWGNA